jgi:hypothetical protein
MESVATLPIIKLCNVTNVCLLLYIKVVNVALNMGTLSWIMPSATMVSSAYYTLPVVRIGSGVKDESKLRDALLTTFDQACRSASHPPRIARGKLELG